MLSTPCYNGQGLGNQLHNIVTVKCLALDKGLDFGVMFPERFKGHSFMKLDFGVKVPDADIPVEGQPPKALPEPLQAYYREAMIGNGEYDPELQNVADNTLIHGICQDIKYIEHRKKEVDEWLKVEPMVLEDNLCVLNIRGGEYKYVEDFILPKSYWDMAILHMKTIRPDMKFEIHTDDYLYARTMFPEYKVVSDIGINWRSIRFAKFLILSNSSFAILPAWLNSNSYVIAPMYFARYNKGYWFLEQNKVYGWNYLYKDGSITKLLA